MSVAPSRPAPVAGRFATWTPSVGSALLVVHGPGVTDRFVAPDYAVREIDVVLWDVLTAAGYERVVFSVPQWPVYFLDARSRELSRTTGRRPAPRAASARMKDLSGPLGDALLVPQAPPVEAPRVMPSSPGTSLSDEAAVTMFGTFLADATVRTALVMTDTENWLRHTGAARSLAVTIGRALDRPTGGNALVLVCKHDTMREVATFVGAFGIYPGLHDHVSRLADAPEHAAWAVGPPEPAELERVVHRARLTYGLRVPALSELPALSRTMASGRVALRTWEARLAAAARDRVPLSQQLLRDRGWATTARKEGGDVWQQLDAMTGLAGVKEHLRRMHRRLQAEKALRERGLATAQRGETLHLMFTGNPGTGKTTVASLIGELYRDLGLLRSGHLVDAKASDLIAQYEGQTAHLVHEAVQKARGGVLLIDEAYQLSERSSGFGPDAINALVQDMDALRDELAIIAVGYTDKMATFLSANPGMRSRFPERNIIEFPDYAPDELLAILLGMLRQAGVSWTAEAEAALREVTEGMYARRAADFGNAREMRSLTEELIGEWADQVGTAVEQPITPAHLPARVRGYLPDRDVPSVEELFKELDALVGLDAVKQVIRRLVMQILLQKRRAASGMKVTEIVAPHMLFVGPPGTGKTTVARMTGQLLRSVGLLRKGHVVEVGRDALVAQWQGQTAPRTKEAVNSAREGVLFIDEAYSLAPENPFDNFGQEAVAALVQEMENARGRLVVVAAGYPPDMESFLARNVGLRSRFSMRVVFPDYTGPEMVEILRRLAAAEDYVLASGVEEKAEAWLTEERRRVPPNQFGNARAVRELFATVVGRLADRVLASGDSERADLRTIKPEDVPDVRG